MPNRGSMYLVEGIRDGESTEDEDIPIEEDRHGHGPDEDVRVIRVPEEILSRSRPQTPLIGPLSSVHHSLSHTSLLIPPCLLLLLSNDRFVPSTVSPSPALVPIHHPNAHFPPQMHSTPAPTSLQSSPATSSSKSILEMN